MISSSMIDPILQQELRSRFNPDGSPLRRHQLLMLDMLKKIDRICVENNIKYWLSSGTCIGALRHGGFIPWDDDVDLEMLEDDFKKLRRVMRAYDGGDLVWQDSRSDFEYVQPFAKIRDTRSVIHEIPDTDRNYRYRGVFIDIFAIRPSGSLNLYKLGGKLQTFFLYRPQYIGNRFLRRATIAFSRLLVTKGLLRLISLVDGLVSNGQYRHLPGTAFHRPRFKSDVVSTRLTKFEDTELPVPINAEHYLEQIYGDFHKIPPLDSIVPHISDISYK
ncbi:LicD family protein [uncultured Duncaniella sp.]|uniref:LicD family protein n=2 Tax=uncultured Duncaniella sp. TaxID=2768039 RepID=UPI0025E1D830|nr:LicD family protein [uncultured Duncaniella sp.]